MHDPSLALISLILRTSFRHYADMNILQLALQLYLAESYAENFPGTFFLDAEEVSKIIHIKMAASDTDDYFFNTGAKQAADRSVRALVKLADGQLKSVKF